MQIHGGEGKTENIRLDFSVNINPLGMPKAVWNAWQSLASDPAALEVYPDRSCEKLRRAAAGHYRIPEDWIVCGCGASELIYKIAYRYRGCRALVVSPGFGEYEKALREAGCQVRTVELKKERGFAFDEDFMERFCRAVDEDGETCLCAEYSEQQFPVIEHLHSDCVHAGNRKRKKKLALVILCSPNNPVGGRISDGMLRKMMSFCMCRGIRVVVDECFLPFVTGEEPTIGFLKESAERKKTIESSACDEKDIVFESPACDEKDIVSESPADDEKDIASESPADDEKDIASESSADDEKDIVFESPADDEKDIASESPADDEKDIVSESPADDEKDIAFESLTENEKKKVFEGSVEDGKESSKKEVVSPVIIKALTKSHAIPGVRLGLAISSDTKLICELQEAGAPWTVSGIAAKLGEAAFAGWDEEEFESMRKTVAAERAYLVRGLTEAGAKVYFGEGNFILFSVPGGKTLFSFMRDHGILIRSCESFGLGEDFYRIAVRTREENRCFLESLFIWSGKSA